MKEPELGDFEVRHFVDVQSSDVLPSIESELSSARPEDLILIYYSGHGKLDANGNLCLTTSNTRLATLQTTSIPLRTLKSLIDQSRSNAIVLMLDCCFSGAAGKAFFRSAVDDQFALLKGAGVHILTSSTAVETSQEHECEEQGEVLGVFTRWVAEGIRSGEADLDRDGEITLTELQQFLETRIRGQSPKSWAFEASGKIVLARHPDWAKFRLPQLTNRMWTLHQAIDEEGSDFSGSTLRFLTQDESKDGLKLSGLFEWKVRGDLVGTEKVKGHYDRSSRKLFLKGTKEKVSKAKGGRTVQGEYTAVLSENELLLSDGTWVNAPETGYPLRGHWQATR